jgi:hypothetical protein
MMDFDKVPHQRPKYIWYEIAILWYEMVNYGAKWLWCKIHMVRNGNGTKWLWYEMTSFVLGDYHI